ncbi:MAG TPA: ribose-phosphate pyrophosphokinase [Limnochordia bacterium]|nr:ribose-phosphate pyrophosphokinase [Limnochordia bacterium]
MKLFSGRATRELAQAICAELGVAHGQSEIFKFSNDNTFVRVLENVREHNVYVVQTSTPPVDEALMELLILIDALKRASACRLTAVLPYFPYVRSDKKDQPRVPITARLVSDLLITAGVDRVVTVDLTADQIQGFFSIPVDHLTAQVVLAEHFGTQRLDDVVIVAPDPGAVKRAQRFAQRLGVPVAFVDKRRVGGADEVQATAVVGDVKDRHAILFDEEIDRGTTVCQAAKLLRAAGAHAVSAACTHAVFSGPATERLQSAELREIVVVDTVPVPQAKRLTNLTVLPIAPLLAEAIRRIDNGESVSALF